MSFDAHDFVDEVVKHLPSLGYSFHSSEPDDGVPVPGCIPEIKHWFCWTNGKVDVEVGEDCDSLLAAQCSAVEHWFKNSIFSDEF